MPPRVKSRGRAHDGASMHPGLGYPPQWVKVAGPWCRIRAHVSHSSRAGVPEAEFPISCEPNKAVLKTCEVPIRVSDIS